MNILVDIYRDSTATLVLHKKSRNFPIRKGFTHGDTISPMLFTAHFEEVFKPIDGETLGVRINGEYLSNLRFSEEVLLFSNTGDKLEQMIVDLNRVSIRVWLKINMQKTSIVFNGLAREQEFRIVSQPLESVPEYVYLGQLLTGHSDHEEEIYKRIEAREEVKVRANSDGTRNVVLNVKRPEESGVVERENDEKKWSWAGHVMRKVDDRWTMRVTEWAQGERCVGRQ